MATIKQEQDNSPVHSSCFLRRGRSRSFSKLLGKSLVINGSFSKKKSRSNRSLSLPDNTAFVQHNDQNKTENTQLNHTISNNPISIDDQFDDLISNYSDSDTDSSTISIYETPSDIQNDGIVLNPSTLTDEPGINLDELTADITNVVVSLPYEHGPRKYEKCEICLDYDFIYERICCSLSICDTCMKHYAETKIKMGIVRIACPMNSCKKYVSKSEIMYHLPNDAKIKFQRYLVDKNCKPNEKTCPHCSKITLLDSNKIKYAPKKGLVIVCEDCQFNWCFICHGPLHPDLTCKQILKGTKLLRQWAKQQGEALEDRPNAVKCPKCRSYIQKSSGCDHMVCNHCSTNFCYRCGGRLFSLKGFGDHYTKLSIFGCKYRYLPNKPVRRRFIRGSIFTAKILAIPIGGPVALAGAAVVGVGAVLFFLPCLGLFKCYKYMQDH